MTKPTKKTAVTDAKNKPRSLPLSRPAKPEDIIELARQYGPACVRTLAEVAAGGDTSSARVAAANALLDRGLGKVGQPLEVTGKGGSPLAVAHGITPALAEALATLKGNGDA